MNDRPWMKFYPADWRADPALKMCSLAARGLWIEMLALMHEAEPRGHLLIRGRAPTDANIAALVGCSVDDVVTLIAELETAGVFDRRRNGVIVSRRMEKDEINASKSRDNGKKGGNPSLRKKTEKSDQDNPPDKPSHTHKPEARGQIPEVSSLRSDPETGSSLRSDPPPPAAAAGARGDFPPRAFEEFWSAYPAKVGKAAAERKFDTLRRSGKVSFAAIMAGLDAYKRGKPADRDWCHPTTWLNQGRWEDEHATGPKAASPEQMASRVTVRRIDPEWPAMEERWRREKGRPPPPSLEWQFPREWLEAVDGKAA